MKEQGLGNRDYGTALGEGFMVKEWWTRFKFLVAPRKPGELDEELRFHVEQSVERNVAAGMNPQEARRLALIELGGGGSGSGTGV
ncbi:MAG: permease prefix domain 1-containing protein [Terracidiphilus sp.]|jgi:hypothetical protein